MLQKMADSSFVNAVFWFVILLFLSYWIASVCFIPYLIISILTPCFPGLKAVSDLLLAGIMFPYKCSDNMVNRRSYNSI